MTNTSKHPVYRLHSHVVRYYTVRQYYYYYIHYRRVLYIGTYYRITHFELDFPRPWRSKTISLKSVHEVPYRIILSTRSTEIIIIIILLWQRVQVYYCRLLATLLPFCHPVAPTDLACLQNNNNSTPLLTLLSIK